MTSALHYNLPESYNIPKKYSLVRIDEASRYECFKTNRHRLNSDSWLQIDDFSRTTLVRKHVVDATNPYLLREYVFHKQRNKWIPEKAFVLFMCPENSGKCERIKLGKDFKITKAKVIQLEKRLKKAQRKKSSQENNDQENNDTAFQTLIHQIPNHQPFLNRQPPNPQPLSQASPHRAHKPSPTLSAVALSPSPTLLTEGPVYSLKFPNEPLENQLDVLNIPQKAPWGPEKDGSFHYNNNSMEIINATNNLGHVYLVNHLNPSAEVLKIRKWEGAFRRKNTYTLIGRLYDPNEVYLVSIKKRPPSKPPQAPLPLSFIQAQVVEQSDKIDYSKLMFESPTKTQPTLLSLLLQFTSNTKISLVHHIATDVTQKNKIALTNLSQLIPSLDSRLSLDLHPVSINFLPESLKKHPVLQSFPFLGCIDKQTIYDKDITKFIRKMGHQDQSYFVFLVCHTDVTKLCCFLVQGKTIKNCGKYSLYINWADNSSKGEIYITKGFKFEQQQGETEPQLFENWLETFREKKQCVSYNKLGVDISKKNDLSFSNQVIIKQKRATSSPAGFAEIFTYNIENKWDFPIVFTDNLQNATAESSYFFFKKDKDRSDRIVLVFCEKDKKAHELTYNIVSASKDSVSLSVEYTSEPFLKKKQFIDLKVLFQLLVEKGLEPKYSFQEDLEPPDVFEREKEKNDSSSEN